MINATKSADTDQKRDGRDGEMTFGDNKSRGRAIQFCFSIEVLVIFFPVNLVNRDYVKRDLSNR